jgi:hypothetical protein
MAEVVGTSTASGTAGVTGESSQFNGVLGTTTADGHAGVAGVCDVSNGNGVYGRSMQASGVFGVSSAIGSSGVVGINDDGGGTGVYGGSARNDGVLGVTTGEGKAGVAGVCDVGNGNGLYGRSQAGIGVYGKGGRLAALFEGDVEVTGDIRLANADCAEDFDIAESETIEPGTVMVFDERGMLCRSHHSYDRRVAGVVSGAGDYRPGLVLDRNDSERTRKPIALMGKVFCMVDATYGAIAVGDLLTTSPTPGHAMKANDPFKAFGSVIGKAMRPLPDGRGLVPILIALQ